MARKGIVVGGAGGIGQAIVEAARQAGDDVFILDRATDPGANFIQCDQSDPASVEKAFALLDEAFAGAAPDWMVAAASISRRHSVLDADPETIAELLKVNVLGAALVTQAAGRRMRAAGAGGYCRNHFDCSGPSLVQRVVLLCNKGGASSLGASVGS